MPILSHNLRKFKPGVALGLMCIFGSTTVLPPSYAQGISSFSALPAPGAMVNLSPSFDPVILRGIRVHEDNPFRLDFILDLGGTASQNELALRDTSNRLIKYFLAALTVPEKNLWVNLSPEEKDRIIPQGLDVTEMGRDLLAQDYILKQITSSLMYPEKELGQKFWQQIYQKAYETYGTTKIPINTFNKVWIVPESAIVDQSGNTAFVIQSHLKVMLEEEYLEQIEKRPVKVKPQGQELTELVRQIILPAIEKEVNEGEHFAPLRQVYHSIILATWFKQNLKGNLLERIYVGKNKVTGINLDDPNIKQEIYDQYLQAFKKGVYNYIREEVDPATKQLIPRKYFSGGTNFTAEEMGNAVETRQVAPEQSGRDVTRVQEDRPMAAVPVGLDVAGENTGDGPGQGTSGHGQFIGKYVATSAMVFDRERMEIRFTAYHIDRSEDIQEIVLQVRRVMTKR
ncbi:MAG: hypothetical protein NUV91_03400, partial [Candidatus Omnitrophica bacterium]|nr:hypothetical protein [Candidatus Omnitrophota bacterium]